MACPNRGVALARKKSLNHRFCTPDWTSPPPCRVRGDNTHAAGRNFVVVPDLPAPLERKHGKLNVTFLSLAALEKALGAR
jgi:hypothetical protein